MESVKEPNTLTQEIVSDSLTYGKIESNKTSYLEQIYRNDKFKLLEFLIEDKILGKRGSDRR